MESSKWIFYFQSYSLLGEWKDSLVPYADESAVHDLSDSREKPPVGWVFKVSFIPFVLTLYISPFRSLSLSFQIDILNRSCVEEQLDGDKYSRHVDTIRCGPKDGHRQAIQLRVEKGRGDFCQVRSHFHSCDQIMFSSNYLTKNFFYGWGWLHVYCAWRNYFSL